MNNDVRKLAVELANQYLKAYDTYKSIVNNACNNLISETELRWLLDHLLEFCEYNKNDELFFELCNAYDGVYPECVQDYKILHDDKFN